VGVAALVLGIIGVVVAFIPMLGYTQLIGVVLGIVALILGVLGRKQLAAQGQPTGTAMAGLVLGCITIALSVLLYASCMYCTKRVGDELKRQLGSPEFKKAMESVRQQQEKNVRQVEKALKKLPQPAQPEPR